MILVKNLYNKSYMFKDCKHLKKLSIKDKIENDIKDIDNYEEKIIKYENNKKLIDKQIEKEKEIENIFEASEKSSFNQSGASSFYNNINSFVDLTITGLRNEEKNQDYSSMFDLINDINKTSEYYTMLNGMFKNCISLSSITYISKWKSINIINISEIFSGCSEFISLTDISI